MIADVVLDLGKQVAVRTPTKIVKRARHTYADNDNDNGAPCALHCFCWCTNGNLLAKVRDDTLDHPPYAGFGE